MPLHRLSRRAPAAAFGQAARPRGVVHFWLTRVSLLVLVSVIFASSVTAQTARNSPGVFGVPKSDEIVEVEVHFNNGEIVPVSVREGTLFTVRTDSYYYAFSPKIDASNGEVRFELFDVEVVPGPEGGEIASAVGVIRADLGEIAWSKEEPVLKRMDLFFDFDLRVGTVRTGRGFSMPSRKDPSLTKDPEALRRMAARGTCCIQTCNGAEVCGCSVQSACASCCTGGCCGVAVPGILSQQGLRALPGDP